VDHRAAACRGERHGPLPGVRHVDRELGSLDDEFDVLVAGVDLDAAVRALALVGRGRRAKQQRAER
jgi:hypothetical protein